MNKLHVRDWMTPNPVTISKQTTLPEAERLMREHQIRRLPVMDDNKLVGIVTLGNVREARPSDATTLSVYELNYLLGKLTAKDFMSQPVFTISPNHQIQEAAKMMLDHKIGGLPVVEDEKLVGMITETDFCRLLIEIKEKQIY